jgi:hypothetical protein
MNDRLAEIEARKEWLRAGMMNAADALWLIEEATRLRAETSAIRSRLVKAMPGSAFESDSVLTLLDAVLYQRRGAMIELSEIHDVLAEALGYTQDAPDDPESPCPGGWVTGDHTAASLTLEAARKLKGQESVITDVGRSVNQTREYNIELAQQLEMAQDRIRDIQKARQFAAETATRHIVSLQHELAGAKRSKPKKRELEEIIDRQERELAARKLQCFCVFKEEGIDEGRLLPRIDCPTHGVEANDRRLAGEKALNTLMYVRKYFMGSEHGHEV